MKPGGGGDKMPGKLEKQITADFGSVAKMKEDFIQAGVTQFGSGWCWLAVKDGKIEVMKTPNGEKPAGPRRAADPRLRRVGALLLHRLPQPAPGLSQGLRRPPGQLGLRRRNVRGGAIAARPFAEPWSAWLSLPLSTGGEQARNRSPESKSRRKAFGRTPRRKPKNAMRQSRRLFFLVAHIGFGLGLILRRREAFEPLSSSSSLMRSVMTSVSSASTPVPGAPMSGTPSGSGSSTSTYFCSE